MRWIVFPVISISLILSLWSHSRAEPGSSPPLEKLRAAAEKVRWDPASAISGNFTCSGVSEKVFAGYTKNRVWIGVVSSGDEKKPIVADFPAGTQPIGQDAFCAERVTVAKEPRDCLDGEDTPLPGCKRIKQCVAFRVYDGECDGFHFYWDNRRKRLTYWRL